MLKEEAELKILKMEMEANRDEACDYMDKLLGICLSKVEEDRDFEEGCDGRMETQEDHFQPNYHSQPKKNDLREITNAFKIKSYMGKYWYQPGQKHLKETQSLTSIPKENTHRNMPNVTAKRYKRIEETKR